MRWWCRGGGGAVAAGGDTHVFSLAAALAKAEEALSSEKQKTADLEAKLASQVMDAAVQAAVLEEKAKNWEQKFIDAQQRVDNLNLALTQAEKRHREQIQEQMTKLTSFAAALKS